MHRFRAGSKFHSLSNTLSSTRANTLPDFAERTIYRPPSNIEVPRLPFLQEESITNAGIKTKHLTHVSSHIHTRPNTLRVIETQDLFQITAIFRDFASHYTTLSYFLPFH